MFFIFRQGSHGAFLVCTSGGRSWPTGAGRPVKERWKVEFIDHSWEPKSNIQSSMTNTHHVEDNKHSGHGVAPQENPQPYAERTRFSINICHVSKRQIHFRAQSYTNTIKYCPYLKRSMVLAALRTLPYIPGLSWLLNRTGVFLCRAPERSTCTEDMLHHKTSSCGLVT